MNNIPIVPSVAATLLASGVGVGTVVLTEIEYSSVSCSNGLVADSVYRVNVEQPFLKFNKDGDEHVYHLPQGVACVITKKGEA